MPTLSTRSSNLADNLAYRAEQDAMESARTAEVARLRAFFTRAELARLSGVLESYRPVSLTCAV